MWATGGFWLELLFLIWQVIQQEKHPGVFLYSAAIALDSGFITVSVFITTLPSTSSVHYGVTCYGNWQTLSEKAVQGSRS